MVYTFFILNFFNFCCWCYCRNLVSVLCFFFDFKRGFINLFFGCKIWEKKYWVFFGFVSRWGLVNFFSCKKILFFFPFWDFIKLWSFLLICFVSLFWGAPLVCSCWLFCKIVFFYQIRLEIALNSSWCSIKDVFFLYNHGV